MTPIEKLFSITHSGTIDARPYGLDGDAYISKLQEIDASGEYTSQIYFVLDGDFNLAMLKELVEILTKEEVKKWAIGYF